MRKQIVNKRNTFRLHVCVVTERVQYPICYFVSARKIEKTPLITKVLQGYRPIFPRCLTLLITLDLDQLHAYYGSGKKPVMLLISVNLLAKN